MFLFGSAGHLNWRNKELKLGKDWSFNSPNITFRRSHAHAHFSRNQCDINVDVIALAGCFYLLLNTGERRKLSNSVGFHFSFFALFRIDYKREREIRGVQKEFTLEAGTGFSS